MLDVIAFDADDTLWHNERLYSMTQERFKELLSRHHSREEIERRLFETEMRNLRAFGYGIKGFALSMIETAIDLTDGRIQGREVQEIIGFAKEMLRAPVQLLDGAGEVVDELARAFPLMLITKGDLFDQETKIARSGLADRFAHIEIVSDKTTVTYGAILEKHGLDPLRFLMVGNSMRSDILPVLELGGQAVFIPYEITWAHESETDPRGRGAGYHELERIDQLPALIERLSGGTPGGNPGAA